MRIKMGYECVWGYHRKGSKLNRKLLQKQRKKCSKDELEGSKKKHFNIGNDAATLRGITCMSSLDKNQKALSFQQNQHHNINRILSTLTRLRTLSTKREQYYHCTGEQEDSPQIGFPIWTKTYWKSYVLLGCRVQKEK